MTFEVLPIEYGDISEIVDIRAEAFEGSSSLHDTCLPRTPGMRAVIVAGFQYSFKHDPSFRCIKLTDTSKPSGAISAMAVWYVPSRRPDGTAFVGGSWPEDYPMTDWPSECDAQLNNEVFQTFAEKRRAFLGRRPHYYLEQLATLPKYRGLGAAKALIEWGLKQADEERYEAYVEANDALVPFYRKFGWKVMSRYTNERLAHTEAFMLRPGIIDRLVLEIRDETRPD